MTVTITFACPKCGREIRVKDEAAGKTGRCNGCKSSIVVPAAPISGELIPAAQAMLAIEPPRRPPARNLAPEDNLEAPSPRQQPAPPAYHPPNIIVNVVQHTQAHATAVAIVGGRPYSNGWANAALLLAVLSLLISWIPFVGTLAFIGVGLALLLAAVGFLASLFHGGRGMISSIGAACLSVVAMVVAFASTAVGTAAVAAKNAADAERERAVATPVRPAPVRVVEKPAPRVAATAAPIVAAPVQRPATDPVVAEPTPAEREADARKKFAGILTNGKSLAKAGVLGGAEKVFRRVIDGAPGTAIAAEAQKELDGLPPH
jgi:hypothetical protein